MTVERTLARVEDDLRKGDFGMARTRLRSLVESLPQSLEAREQLARVYRLEGNRIEAGRWSYLADNRDPAEVEAFETACRHDPVRIMRSLRWSGLESEATTPAAHELLTDIRARAEAAAGKKLDWAARGADLGERGWDPFEIGCLLGVCVLVALLVIGAVTVVDWIF